jgi:aspartyl protease family protein
VVIRNCIALVAALTACPALATEVSVIGYFGDQAAILVIDGGAPRAVRVGQKSPEGVTVLAIDGNRVTLSVDGERRVMQLGNEYLSAHDPDSRENAVLSADTRGHFVADGLVDGSTVRFVVDTGATVVALPAKVAERLGINYHKGLPTMTQTANGDAPAWRITLDRVKVGSIALDNVDAIVIEHGLNVALLGMSFLNRVEMRRDGETMVLTRLY